MTLCSRLNAIALAFVNSNQAISVDANRRPSCPRGHATSRSAPLQSRSPSDSRSSP
jgi:hypothetical protein